MQKNYYLCKLLRQLKQKAVYSTKNGLITPLRCFADSVGKVTKIY